MGWQSEAFAEHPGKVVFGERAQRSQLSQTDGLGQSSVDVLHQHAPLVGSKPALETKALARADLAEQQVAEHVMGEAGGEQALGGLVPVQVDQLAKALRLLRVVKKRRFVQL